MRSLDDMAALDSLLRNDEEGTHHQHQYGGRDARAALLNIMEFISKINQTVLRARVACLQTNLNGNVLDTVSLMTRLDFWRSGLPVNVDIFVSASRRLMERWIISFEHYNSDRVTSNDVTDLILLAQSLYSYVRLLPLQSALSEGNLRKSSLQYCVSTADGCILASSEDNGYETGSSGFDLSAKLKVYKFRSASTSYGKLHLSVVYDANLANFVKTVSPSPTKASTSGGQIEKKEDVASPTPKQSNQRSSNGGSPFPSPKLTRKVVALSHLKLEALKSKPFEMLPQVEPQSIPPAITQQGRRVSLTVTTPTVSPNSKAVPVPMPSLSVTRSSSPTDSDLDADGVSRNRHILQHESCQSDQSLRLEVDHLPHSSPNMSKSASDGSYNLMGNLQRRLSFGAINHGELFGSLVGSYEESILSGRMSTLPSKPITFIAQIGVVAFGKCKPSLQCPPHINVKFPAYFYEMYGDSAVATPYVGSIDLDAATLSPAEDSEHSSKTPGYRLPPRGQLQILIKNPSKATVKVFLVPYDLRDMPPATKTFLRQKSYAISYINNTPIDTTASTTSSKPAPSFNLFAPSSQTSPAHTSPVSTTSSNNSHLPPRMPASNVNHHGSVFNLIDKDKLRYAIHLQITSTPRKRLYLSKSVRVVFSPRQPESDEKLRVVCEGPENPKYLPLDSVTPVNEFKRRSHGLTNKLMAAGVSPSDFSVSPVRSSPWMMHSSNSSSIHSMHHHSSHHHLLYTQSHEPRSGDHMASWIEEDLQQSLWLPNSGTQ
ncbi:hypothetical protein SeMB42_g02397 [Synchytrium endobioticum]|nr:hypothetical protein SeMB42_g02397 [Synchytrium endobioticum]